MTTTEAMKLALEALEAFLRFAAIHHDGPDTSDKYLAEDYAVEGFRKARQVLPALRTAIETAEKPTGKQSLQVEQEPVAWYYEIDQSKTIAFAPDRDPNIPWQPLYKHPAPVSDPVAWMVYTLDGQSVCVTDNPADFGESHRALPLYTTPPAQRQPLTLGQKQRLWSSVGDKPTLKDRVNAYGLAIEAAHGIQEKNT